MAEYADRKTALDKGASKYWTGKQCKNGHQSYRWTLNGACIECQNNTRKTVARRFKEARKTNEE